MSNFGYHLKDIEKGILGEISKIEEELNEMKDAKEQGSKIMELVELSDFIGALELHLNKYYKDIPFVDIISHKTSRKFVNINEIEAALNQLKIINSTYHREAIIESFSNIINTVRDYLLTEHSGIKLNDLIKMKDITKRAFENGHRT